MFLFAKEQHESLVDVVGDKIHGFWSALDAQGAVSARRLCCSILHIGANCGKEWEFMGKSRGNRLYPIEYYTKCKY